MEWGIRVQIVGTDIRGQIFKIPCGPAGTVPWGRMGHFSVLLEGA